MGRACVAVLVLLCAVQDSYGVLLLTQSCLSSWNVIAGWFIQTANLKHQHSDSIIQISMTFICAYLRCAHKPLVYYMVY